MTVTDPTPIIPEDGTPPEQYPRRAVTRSTSAIDRALALLDDALAPDGYPADDTDRAEREAAVDALTAEVFRIDGERTALWAVGKLRRAEARIAEAEATAAELRRLADEHVARAKADEDRTVRYFSGLLRQYHAEALAGTRKKSLTLPDGSKLAESVGGVSAVYTDADGNELADDPAAIESAALALVAWLEDHADDLPDAVRYANAVPDRPAIKKAGADGKVDTEPGLYPAVVPATGEVIPHLAYRRGGPTFTIKLADLDDAEG
jgi:hypothetical protein